MTVLAACGGRSPSSSGPTSGTGATKSDARNLHTFTRVDVGNGIGLTIQVGGAQAVKVTAQENILPLIETSVEAGTLSIHSSESFTATAEVTVTTSVSALDGISVGGGSEVQLEGLESDHLDIVLSSGASLAATGRATRVTLGASGGARADLSTLRVDVMSIELSEGANAALRVSDELTGAASGGAVAQVAGGASLDVQTSGGASLASH